MKWILPFVCAAPVWAQDCPPAQDFSAEMAVAVARLQSSAGPTEAAPLSQLLWDIWLVAPDQKAQGILDTGMRLREQGDFQAAVGVLDELVTYCPDYAEGYNQRAFASFLLNDFEASLADLDRAIDLIPTHVAALSGRGLALIGLGRQEDANASFQAALALNPWLAERRFIIEPEGTDI